MENTKCKQVGKLTGGKWDRLHDISRRVYDISGLSPTIHTAGGGQQELKIVEPLEEYRFYQQAVDTLRENGGNEGDTVDAYNKRINKDGVSPTITTRPDGLKTAILPITKDCRIRKLTPNECFRLMGVRDEDFERVAKNQSQSSLYHLAGDSIVTAVLMAIFAKMIKNIGEIL